MGLFIIKYLIYLISEGEKTSSEIADELRDSIYNVSHAMSMLYRFGLITHPSKRVRSWVLNSSNELVRLIEKLVFVSKNDPEVKQLLSQKSIILIGSEFYNNKAGITIKILIDSTKLSKVTIIKSLKKLKILKLIKKAGKSNNYPSQTNSAGIFFNVCFLIRGLFNKNIELSLLEIIEQLKNDNSVLVLVHYGSSARGTIDEFSDIDIFVVTRDKISRGDIISKYSNKKIDLNVYSKKGFLELLKSQPDFIRNLSMSKVLKGKDILEAVI